MIGLLLTTVDVIPSSSTGSQAIFEQLQYSPVFSKGAKTEMVVSIDTPAYVIINPPSVSYAMNQAQREAMDRAFWRSVEVLDNGSEG